MDLDRYWRRQNFSIFGKKGKGNLEFLEEDALHTLLTTLHTARAALKINSIRSNLVIPKAKMTLSFTKISFGFDLFPLPQCKAATNAGFSPGAGIVIPNQVYTTEPLGRASRVFCKAFFGV